MKLGKEVYDTQDTIRDILRFCRELGSLLEITEHIGYKERKSTRKLLAPLIDSGHISMTAPDKPTSRNQKYVSISIDTDRS